MRRAACIAAATVCAMHAVQSAASAQTAETPAGVTAPQVRDTLAPAISPRGAFLRSLLVPGWGQARLDRGTAGAVFVMTEVIAAAMIVKSKRALDRAKAARSDSVFLGYELDGTGSPVLDEDGEPIQLFGPDPLGGRTESRRQQLEDWIAIIAFNHLFAGADAFVAGHLGDIPRRLSMRPTVDGVALTARLAW